MRERHANNLVKIEALVSVTEGMEGCCTFHWLDDDVRRQPLTLEFGPGYLVC